MPKNPYASPHAVAEPSDAWPAMAYNQPGETDAERLARFRDYDALLQEAVARGEQFARELPALQEEARKAAIDAHSSEAFLDRDAEMKISKIREERARRRR